MLSLRGSCKAANPEPILDRLSLFKGTLAAYKKMTYIPTQLLTNFGGRLSLKSVGCCTAGSHDNPWLIDRDCLFKKSVAWTREGAMHACQAWPYFGEAIRMSYYTKQTQISSCRPPHIEDNCAYSFICCPYGHIALLPYHSATPWNNLPLRIHGNQFRPQQSNIGRCINLMQIH